MIVFLNLFVFGTCKSASIGRNLSLSKFTFIKSFLNELLIKNDADEFLDSFRLRSIITKYSNYIPFPIILDDLDNSKEKELGKNGATIATNLNELFNLADMIITCLPGGDFVKDIYLGEKKIASEIKPNKFIIGMSTSQPDLMTKINKTIKDKKSSFADAPIARTRQAAIDGTLAIMVGSNQIVFQTIKPVLELMGSEIMHCGEVGSGQFTKILNNMILLAELRIFYKLIFFDLSIF
mgnify:CR=1 FL=1